MFDSGFLVVTFFPFVQLCLREGSAFAFFSQDALAAQPPTPETTAVTMEDCASGRVSNKFARHAERRCR